MRFAALTLFVSACLLLSTLVAASSASAQVLNLSQDLVSMGIAASNMTPNHPSLDSRPLFQAGVAYASANHIPKVVAKRGNYYFLSLNSPYQHVFLNAPANVTVDLHHSNLFFAQGNIMAIDIKNSVNLTLENFTVDYLNLPFTQVTITSVDSSTRTIGIAQLGTYPLPSSFSSLTVPSGYINNGYFAYVFRNGQPLPTTGRMSVSTPLSDTSVVLAGTEPWTQAAELDTIKYGDTLVLEWRAGIGAIYSTGSTGLVLQNVSIYASGFIGAFIVQGSAATVDHVQVMPPPGTDRLISTNADGIHLSRAGANNAVTNSTVKRTLDDAIAMDGQWAAIVNAVFTPTSVQVARNNTAPLPIGQSLDFINVLDATIAGTTTVLDENPEPSAQTGAAGELITLTLDTPVAGLQPNFGATPHDPALRGSGTVISGNLAQEIVFGRGIYPAGVANVTIHDNMTEITNRAGVVVEQDEGLSYNYKTGPSSGIVIDNNIVDNALTYGIPSAPLLTDAAAINVIAYDEHFAWVTTQSLADISVTNNFVTNVIRSGIRMENVATGAVTGNTVLNYGSAPDSNLWFLPACAGCESQAQVEAEFAEPVVVVNSTGVTDTPNVTAGSFVSNQSFADSSYRFAPSSIVVARGQNFTHRTDSASGTPLPHKLAGVTVSVLDSAGAARLAGLYYASPGEVVYVMPNDTVPGVVTVTVASQPSGALVSSVAPGLFSANGTGSGVALATAERTTGSGQQISEPVYQCSPAACVALPLSLGNASATLLVTFQATGIEDHGPLKHMVADIGGTLAKVEAAGKLAGAGPGMDYVTVKIPHSLAGAGEVPVTLTVDGFTSNAVTINIK